MTNWQFFSLEKSSVSSRSSLQKVFLDICILRYVLTIFCVLYWFFLHRILYNLYRFLYMIESMYPEICITCPDFCLWWNYTMQDYQQLSVSISNLLTKLVHWLNFHILYPSTQPLTYRKLYFQSNDFYPASPYLSASFFIKTIEMCTRLRSNRIFDIKS